MSYEIKGKLIEKFETIPVNDKFKKRQFVIEYTDNDYVNIAVLELTQDKCSLIDSVNIGSEINVSFNLRCNKYEKNGKVSYFTNLQAWKIDIENAGTAPDLESNNFIDDNEPPF